MCVSDTRESWRMEGSKEWRGRYRDAERSCDSEGERKTTSCEKQLWWRANVWVAPRRHTEYHRGADVDQEQLLIQKFSKFWGPSGHDVILPVIPQSMWNSGLQTRLTDYSTAGFACRCAFERRLEGESGSSLSTTSLKLPEGHRNTQWRRRIEKHLFSRCVRVTT